MIPGGRSKILLATQRPEGGHLAISNLLEKELMRGFISSEDKFTPNCTSEFLGSEPQGGRGQGVSQGLGGERADAYKGEGGGTRWPNFLTWQFGWAGPAPA